MAAQRQIIARLCQPRGDHRTQPAHAAGNQRQRAAHLRCRVMVMPIDSPSSAYRELDDFDRHRRETACPIANSRSMI